jgi:CBS domain-containing protein
MPNSKLVQDIMMRNFKKIDGITKVSEVLNMMRLEKISAILIQPRSEMDVYGIVTMRDIAKKVIGQRRKLDETHVYEIMSKPVLSIPPNMPLPYAARHLTNFNVSYAIVLENNNIIGMVSLHGIAQYWDQE